MKPPAVRTDGRPIRRTSKRAAKRGAATRIMMVLLDGKPHTLFDHWGFIAAAVEPQSAVGIYTKRYKNVLQNAIDNPQEAVDEGTRLAILHCVKRLEKEGIIAVSYPDPVVRSKRGHTGYVDVRLAVAMLTPMGFAKIMDGPTQWGRISSELYLGLKHGRLEVEIKTRSP